MAIPENDSFCVGNPFVRSKEVSVCLNGDMAVLFNPDNSQEKYLNSTGFFIWQRLNGKNTAHDIVKVICKHFESPSPESVLQDTVSFIKELARDGFLKSHIRRLKVSTKEGPVIKWVFRNRTIAQMLPGKKLQRSSILSYFLLETKNPDFLSKS